MVDAVCTLCKKRAALRGAEVCANCRVWSSLEDDEARLRRIRREKIEAGRRRLERFR